MSLESDEEIARQLQAEFDEEFTRGTHNTRSQHEISDSDKTMSEDELKEMQKQIVNKQSKQKSMSKPTPVVHDISDSDDEPPRPKTSTKVRKTPEKSNSLVVVHEISDSNSDEEKSQPTKRENPNKINKKMTDDRPVCHFGAGCSRKNPVHRKMYKHEEKDEIEAKRLKLATNSSTGSTFRPNPFGFYLTKVSGIGKEYNITGSIGIRDILSEEMGNLIESAQFNYMHDIQWLVNQYPEKFRSKPLLIVHGEKRDSKKALTKEASAFSNINLCQATLEILFGTHHTKMMILLYDNGLRIVIHTANLIHGDWHQKTQGVWVSPVFPSLDQSESASSGESPTNFKKDFIEYLSAYNAPELNVWIARIKRHDLSEANVFLIGSTPGRHTGDKLSSFGHFKLRKVLKGYGPTSTVVSPAWNVIGQFSSIGSLGASADLWLNKEFLVSLSATKQETTKKLPNLQLIFPSVENVRLSLEGYPAGSCLPYGKEVAKKQQWLHKLFHQWQSKTRGRSCASPHIKTYTRISPSHDSIGWFLLTSANLSKAAWGAMEKNSTQLMVRSYELGVLFLPNYVTKTDTLKLAKTNNSDDFPIPYDIPLTPYTSTDEPWVWNVPHTQLPDRHGNMWKK